MAKQGICVLGSTGTIGVNTLDVISRHPEKYKVIALTANQADEKLYQQCIEFKPQYAVLVNEDAAQRLSKSCLLRMFQLRFYRVLNH